MMTQPPRYLTKSRFKQALECPTKLFYTGKSEYLDNSLEDSFLLALAEGGHQVGALACLTYPGGEMVEVVGHAAQVQFTSELLARDEVTIYEAAFEAEGHFVRVDVLRKCGTIIELIEVKAKSYNPVDDGNLRSAKGSIKPEFLPYLQDIAFQRHVAGRAFPQFTFRCFLMMPDTSRTATVDGLNQRFPIRRDGTRVMVDVAPSTHVADLGESVLTAVSVDGQVAEILEGKVAIGPTKLPFEKAVRQLAEAYQNDQRIDPVPGIACGSCEFRAPTPPQQGQRRSGFHECWGAAFGWKHANFAGGTVLDLWNFRRKGELINQRILKPSQVSKEHLSFDGSEPAAQGMTAKHRQWYQCSAQWPGGGPFYLDRDGLTRAMQKWRYPLHFIDFETSTTPIPFTRGRRPYETTAFQFSHHVLLADGQVEHRSQFLDATPGRNPNVAFLRALRDALATDDGTVFRWAAHENTVLNQLRRQLIDDELAPTDATDLIGFIESLTTRNADKAVAAGPRAMVDLCKLAERFFFHPATEGSSSLKKVLPALMASSVFLRELYCQPVYGSATMPSRNLKKPVVWWREHDGKVCDPYDLLPPVFPDLSRDEQESLEAHLVPGLQDGGAAMAAYALLQFEDLDADQRQAIEAALLRYCELDTLAMVMAVQAWSAWSKE
jgi:hypothetical protein